MQGEPPPAPKISILGAPLDTGNMGVQALAVSLVHLIAEAVPDSKICLMMAGGRDRKISLWDGGTFRDIDVVTYCVSPFRSWRKNLVAIVFAALCYRALPIRSVRHSLRRWFPWIDQIAASDLVGDIRGGDSFSDIYGAWSFLLYCFLVQWTVILVRGEILHFPQTYGPFKRVVPRLAARYLLRNSKTVVARDKQSRSVAESLMCHPNQVLLSPDVAFSLRPAEVSVVELDGKSDTVPARAPVGINVNGLMYNGGYTRDNAFGLNLDYPTFLSSLVEALLDEGSEDLWLIPHTFAAHGNVESDPDAAGRLKAGLQSSHRARVKIVSGRYNPHELKGIIAKCEFFVGSRMHSCIAGLSQGIPTVGVAYSMKFRGVFETVGMQDWIVDARSTDNEAAVDATMELYRKRRGIRALLAKRAANASEDLRTVFRSILIPTRNMVPYSGIPMQEKN